MTVRMPARAAASTFSFTPPIGSTSPRKEISPVIATSARTCRSVRSDASATYIATPALGPSFGIAPAGTCTCTSESVMTFGLDPERVGVPLHEGQRRLHALLHDVAELARHGQPAPLPGTRFASTNRISPPTGVHASPVATPGTPVRIAISFS